MLHRHLQVSSIQGRLLLTWMYHDDVIKWQHFPRNWHFVWGIHWSLVISPHKGQWRGALIFSLICIWTNGWVNDRDAGDLRCHRAHYDVIVILIGTPGRNWNFFCNANRWFLVSMYRYEFFHVAWWGLSFNVENIMSVIHRRTWVN